MSLARIATALDLSVTTVSRALAGYDDVAQATRGRVLAEAERIVHRANRNARRLRTGANDAIGIVLPTGPGQLEDAFFLRVLGTIGPLLPASGLDLMVSAARVGAEEMALYRQLVENRRVDGIFVARTRRHDPRIADLIDSDIAASSKQTALSRRRHPDSRWPPVLLHTNGGQFSQSAAGRIPHSSLSAGEPRDDPAAHRDVVPLRRSRDALGVARMVIFPDALLQLGTHPDPNVGINLAFAWMRLLTERILPATRG